ncbi:MAG TPA: hypothetical protein VF755_27135, partial [Catenuloplanes sp.]
MNASRTRAMLAAGAVAAAMAVGALGGASPASAAIGANCYAIGPDWCQTAIVTATAGGRLVIRADYSKTTCRVYDRDTGVEVGSVSVPHPNSGWYQRSKTLTGLSRDYFATCHNPDGG